jgi:hypothetical protein
VGGGLGSFVCIQPTVCRVATVSWFSLDASLAFVARECVSAVTGLLLGVDVGRDCESERRITEERGGER